MKDTTIIIPTLNEEKNITLIIKKIKKIYSEVKIIVVDDGSSDKTVKNAKKLGAAVIDRKREDVKGLTISVIDGIKKTKTPYLIVMDADLQHPVEKIIELREKLKDYEIVVGVRKKIKEGWSMKRKIMSKTAEILGKIRLMGRIKCKDIMSGFFGAKTSTFKALIKKEEHKFELKGYKVLFDALKIVERGTPIGEVEYEFDVRKFGESKIGKKQVVSYLKSLLK